MRISPSCFSICLPPSSIATSSSTILAAQIFLTTRYRYDLAAENGATYQRMEKANKDKKDEQQESGLMIPDTEMFDLFQQQRPKILQLAQQEIGTNANEVMESPSCVSLQ